MKDTVNMAVADAVAFAYSRGLSKYDNRPDQRSAPNWDAFVAAIWADRSSEKGLTYICAPMIAGMHNDPFKYPGEAHWRQKHLTGRRQWQPFDVDEFADPDVFAKLREHFARYKGIVYTTDSSTAAAPRCRIILLCSRPMKVDESVIVGQVLEAEASAALGAEAVRFDKSVYGGWQPCYLPTVRSERFDLGGDEVDVDEVLARSIPPQSAKRRTPKTAATPDAPSATVAKRPPQIELAADADPTLKALHAAGWVERDMGGGKYSIRCPFEDQHSNPDHDPGNGDTVYYLPHTGGFARGHFDCKHDHCADRTDLDFEAAIPGLGVGFDDLTTGTEDPAARREQQRAENARIQRDEVDAAPRLMTLHEMLAEAVYIENQAAVGLVDQPNHVLRLPDFKFAMAASQVAVANGGKGKKVPVAELWLQHPKRQSVQTRTFRAGAPTFTTNPEGLSALNTWRPIERWAVDGRVDLNLFLDQIAYLFHDPIEREAFIDWLAHIEQRPGELPHYGWLHIATSTGTGRNWLASVLARLWRGQVAPSVDLSETLQSSFNGDLSARVLGIVDEVQTSADAAYKAINRLKQMITQATRLINPKYGRQHQEFNVMRWLVLSNHLNALPLNDTDRRWRVVVLLLPPRSADVYAHLYAALADPEFINAIGVFLRERDISAFRPGERPPLNDSKRLALAASRSSVSTEVDELLAQWPSVAISNHDLAEHLNLFKVDAALRRALLDAGAVQHPKNMKVNGETTRVWLLRDLDRWLRAPPVDIAEEVLLGRECFGLI